MQGHMKTTLLCLVIVTLGSLSACTTVVKEPPASTQTTTTETTVHRPVSTDTQTVRTY
jgi:uncharacterized membrane protein